MTSPRMTRREMLRVVMLGGAGLIAAACAAPQAPQAPAPTAVPEATKAPEAPAPTAVPEATKAPVEPASGKEAPALAELVKQGKLPPLEKRLPPDPMVITPIEEVGTYGGKLAWVIPGPQFGSYEFQFLYEGPYRWSADASKVEPNLAIKHEYAPDGLSMTLEFRQGVRWSDGEPFTADDIDFWWNDLVMNKEAGYTQPYWTITKEQPMKLEKVNDHTVKVTFAAPHWLFHRLMASTGDYMRMYAPKHYLQQFHPKYNTSVKDFKELNTKFTADNNLYTNTDLPVLTAWRTVEYVPGQSMTAERNPYYWKVDTDGKQLPYIDKIVITQVEDPRVIPLKITGGEVDFMARDIPLDSFSTLKTGESTGNYKLIQWKVGAGADPAIVPNWDNPDEIMRKLIRTRDFRLALSHAIDRKTVNDVVYFGLGSTSQAVTSPYSPWGRTSDEGKKLMEEWRNLATEYNVDKANALLDGIGLDKKDSDGYRLRSDGKRLSWVIVTGSTPDSRAVDVLEFVAEDWKKIGIEAKINSMDWSSGFWPKFSTGQYDIAGWDAWTGYDIPTIPDTLFPIGSAYWGTPLTAQWFNTRGEKGIKPDAGDPMDRMIAMYNKMLAENTDEGQNKYVLEAVKVHATEGPFFLGVVNDIPNLVVARPNIKNIPDFAFTGSWAQGAPGCTNPSTYFYKT
jgi:peptide/nickel transport system substrate-binding protein